MTVTDRAAVEPEWAISLHPLAATQMIAHVKFIGEAAPRLNRTGTEKVTVATSSEASLPGGKPGMAEARPASSEALLPALSNRSSTDFHTPIENAGVPKSTPPPLPTPAFQALK